MNFRRTLQSFRVHDEFQDDVDSDVEIITARKYELPIKLEVGGANVEVNVIVANSFWKRPTLPRRRR